MTARTLFSACALGALIVTGAVALSGCATSSGPAASADLPDQIKVATRRITETQYRNTVADVFGPGLAINGRFEPMRRDDLLEAIGTSTLSVTSSGFEQYFAMGRAVSDQVLDARRRDATVGCAPVDATRADDACARQFVIKYGERLFRRPLTEGEIAARVAAASRGAEGGDFYAGLKIALTSLLVAPEFLFRIEQAERDPENRREYRLSAHTKAERLSYLLWDTAPDAELLAAASSGALHTEAGLKAQVDRLLASPKLEQGVRAFFVDMLQFDQFETLSKDAATYPKFSQAIADSAREQTLRTLVDHLITRKRDYRDLFTSNDTFINRHLAAVYQVSFRSRQDWVPYTFADSSERSGVLTQVTFLSLFSHPAASSPTRRGVKLHEIFLCQIMPEPPADVDFSKVQALETGTVRERLIDHMENEGCASCHQVVDPPGLALERFDGLGQLRRLENGKEIDVSANIDGVSFEGAQGLGRYLRGEAAVPNCLVRNVYAYGVGASPATEDMAYLERQTAAFGEAGYRFPDLLASIVTSPEFFKVVTPEFGPAPEEPATIVASAQPVSARRNP